MIKIIIIGTTIWTIAVIWILLFLTGANRKRKPDMIEKAKLFGEKLQTAIDKYYKERFPDSYKIQIACEQVRIIPKRKYIYIDVGSCGKFMLDKDGLLCGIKAYGKIHHGYNYGNIDDWFLYEILYDGYRVKKGEAL